MENTVFVDLPEFDIMSTVGLQWLKHWWLVNHGYFELVLESLGKTPIAADIIIQDS